MAALGWVFAFIGGALFLTALGMTVRANADESIPYFRSPVVSPKGSVAMRSIGAGLWVLSAAALTPGLGYWSIVVVLTAPVAALTVIVVHNRRVAALSPR